ncbi:hypothetical protein RUM43_014955 [Polyplax serrata]|uniref:Protein THEM6 n=1 Tax=Polyplax serrata TaxID=468196 RepID=A0AAN8P0S8_POLSC
MVCACLAVVLLILYIAFDVNYFIRVAFLVGLGQFFKKRVNIFDKTSILGWCTTQDLDIFMRHMNNSRYMRDLDFARFDFYVLTGMYDLMKKKDGHALQGASTIRYRRPIQNFSFYRIETKLIYWEEKAIYLEHQFITPDNFVRAIVLTKQNAINFVPDDLIRTLAKDKYKPPVMPEELREWLTSVETLSAKLRKAD